MGCSGSKESPKAQEKSSQSSRKETIAGNGAVAEKHSCKEWKETTSTDSTTAKKEEEEELGTEAANNSRNEAPVASAAAATATDSSSSSSSAATSSGEGSPVADADDEPAKEEENSPLAGTLRKEGVSTDQDRVVVKQGEEGYLGPGPATDFVADRVYGCFDEGNGLLFRVVSNRRHLWSFYNDTQNYTMYVSVVFGRESMVRPLGQTKLTMLDEKTGLCQLDVVVKPGETQPFMRGEYNGFTTLYDAVPCEAEEEEEEERAETEEAAEDQAEL